MKVATNEQVKRKTGYAEAAKVARADKSRDYAKADAAPNAIVDTNAIR